MKNNIFTIAIIAFIFQSFNAFATCQFSEKIEYIGDLKNGDSLISISDSLVIDNFSKQINSGKTIQVDSIFYIDSDSNVKAIKFIIDGKPNLFESNITWGWHSRIPILGLAEKNKSNNACLTNILNRKKEIKREYAEFKKRKNEKWGYKKVKFGDKIDLIKYICQKDSLACEWNENKSVDFDFINSKYGSFTITLNFSHTGIFYKYTLKSELYDADGIDLGLVPSTNFLKKLFIKKYKKNFRSYNPTIVFSKESEYSYAYKWKNHRHSIFIGYSQEDNSFYNVGVVYVDSLYKKELDYENKLEQEAVDRNAF